MGIAKTAAALCAVVAASLASCGPASTAPASSNPTQAATPSTAPNGWTVSAAAGPNSTVAVTVTVTGPLTVRGGCEPSLTGYLTRQDGSVVPTPRPGIRCLAITLIQIPAGTTHTFTATLQAAGRGDFLVHATLNVASGGGAQPLQVWVTV